MRRAATSIDEAVSQALEPVIARAAAVISRAVARIVAERMELELSAAAPKASSRGAGVRARRSARAPITRWVADRRARRVPNFVIELVGLKTKKAIVAKYGENATFEVGKPAPKVAEPQAAPVKSQAPKAKGPVVRKKAAA